MHVPITYDIINLTHFLYGVSLFSDSVLFNCSLSSSEYETDPLQKVASQLQFNIFDEIVVKVKRVSDGHCAIFEINILLVL